MVIATVLQRADEPGELLGYWTARYGRRIPKPVKRGIADAVQRLYDERSLTLVTPGLRAVGITVGDEEWDKAAEAFADRPWYAATRAAIDVLTPETPRQEVLEVVDPLTYGRWDATARAHAAAAPGQFNWEAADAFHAPGAFDPQATRAALAAVDAPVLVLAGALDAGPTPARAAEAAALFTHAELSVQPRAGHYPWVDDPGAFARTVAAFLDPAVHTVRAGGVRLAYRVWGAQDAPPVVLAHGRGGDSSHWTRVAEQLAATRRVYAPDFPGHGLSDWPGTYGLGAFRDDLSTFITALDLGPVDVVGHSMGGAAAVLLVERHPELVRRLVLEDAPPLLPLDPPRPEPERPDGPLGFDWPLVPVLDAELNEPDPAWWERLAAITAPTLVVAGGPASHIPQDQLAALADRIPDGRLVTIEVGHLVHESRPQEFFAALKSFGL
ncbi:alpha/beta fold hydrolase [Streptomyces xantholiticus]